MAGTIASVIEVTSTPHGNAPLWVREAWVGCMLPCTGYTCGHIPHAVRGILMPQRNGLTPATEFLKVDFDSLKQAGFAVDQEIALQVLAYHNEEAADWFFCQDFPNSDHEWNNFHFRLTEAKVVRYATEAELAGIKLIRYDDMETGQMRPVP